MSTAITPDAATVTPRAETQRFAYGGICPARIPPAALEVVAADRTAIVPSAQARVWHTAASRPVLHLAGAIDLVLVGQARWRTSPDWLADTGRGDLRELAERWRQSGTTVLRDLYGPFFLCVLDRERHSLTLAVDRFGVHSACFALDAEGALHFASHATDVRPAGRAPRLRRQALYDYVHFNMVPSPGTVFEGIEKLAPAECITFRDGRVARETYWEPQFGARGPRDERERSAALMTALDGSVRRHYGPDTATFLSGGIDSSTVTGLAVKAAGAATPAYSMGFEADGYDEARYAQLSAKHFGATLRQFYVVPDDIRAELANVARAYDEPFGNSSAIPTLLCGRRAARDGVRRMLAGDGGDELFGGNARYAKQGVFEIYHGVPTFLRRGLIEPLLASGDWPTRVPGLAKIASYVRQARMPMPDRTESYNFLVRTPPASVFEPDFLRAIDTEHPFHLLRDRYRRAPTTALVDRMLYLDWKFTLADNDLRKVGRMCALAGVDVRYPWLDEDVVEFSTTLAPSDKVHGGELRWFAKRALTGFLPDEVIHKPKHGFGLPFGEWLKTSPPLQQEIYVLLRSLGGRGIVRGDFIEDLIEQHRGGHAAYFGTMVWVLAMLEAWLAEHSLAT